MRNRSIVPSSFARRAALVEASAERRPGWWRSKSSLSRSSAASQTATCTTEIAVECTNTANSCLNVAVPPRAALKTAKRMPVTDQPHDGRDHDRRDGVDDPHVRGHLLHRRPLRLRQCPLHLRACSANRRPARRSGRPPVEKSQPMAARRDEDDQRRTIPTAAAGPRRRRTSREATSVPRNRRGDPDPEPSDDGGKVAAHFTHGTGLVLDTATPRRSRAPGGRRDAHESPSSDDFRAPVSEGVRAGVARLSHVWRVACCRASHARSLMPGAELPASESPMRQRIRVRGPA